MLCKASSLYDWHISLISEASPHCFSHVIDIEINHMITRMLQGRTDMAKSTVKGYGLIY